MFESQTVENGGVYVGHKMFYLNEYCIDFSCKSDII